MISGVRQISIKELKQKEKEQRRKIIINSAEKLFFDKGYDNTSMKDIANEVGVDRTTLYLYFKNKEDMYLAIVLRGMRIRDKLYKESVKSDKDGLEKFGDIGKAYFEFYEKYPDYYEACVYFDSQRFSKVDSEFITEIIALKREPVKIMCKSLEEGINDGSIRPDVNPLKVALFISMTAMKIVKPDPEIVETLENKGISYEEFIEDSFDMWRHMLENTQNKS